MSDNRFEDGLFSIFEDFSELAASMVDDMRTHLEKVCNEYDDKADASHDAGFEDGYVEGKFDTEDRLRAELPDIEKILTAAWTQTHRYEPSDGWRWTKEEPWVSLENELHRLG